jgi:fused signal recognition particle receptor
VEEALIEVVAEPTVIEEVEDEFEPKEEVKAEIVPAVTQEQKRPTKKGLFARLKRVLIKTRQNLGSGFIGLFSGKKIDDDLFEELEEQLLVADVGVEATRKIITSLTEHASRKQLKDAESLYGKLKEEMSEILSKVDKPLDVSGKKPFVILMVGVNGVGKTTTIGKLARQFQAEGKSCWLRVIPSGQRRLNSCRYGVIATKLQWLHSIPVQIQLQLFLMPSRRLKPVESMYCWPIPLGVCRIKPT